MAKDSKIAQLGEFGQSIWLDYISRSLIMSGKLEEMIGQGLRGLTSNPAIFEQAVTRSADYDEIIAGLYRSAGSIFDIYDELTIKDIQGAADMFRDVFKKTKGLDGYVSLEVDPRLAYNTDETIREARRLHKKVSRPNLMIKVPSTEMGFAAIEELTASGVNINVTLIFSLEQYIKSAKAYMGGIRKLLDRNGDVRAVRSVASVFVSRVDTVVDEFLEKTKTAPHLKGKAAVANSQLIYGKYREIISSNEFKVLKRRGANVQRVLWGSTSTKNPAYADIKYVSELIARDSINTVPQKTYEAFMDHGIVREALTGDAIGARKALDELLKAGIDIDDVCANLLKDGVAAFQRSFDSLLHSIEEKTRVFCRA